MKCINCGFEVPDDAIFCSNCGSELSHVADTTGSIKPNLKVKGMLFDTKKYTVYTAKKTKRIVKKLLLPTLSVFIVGGVALVAYNIIKNKEQENIHAIHDQALQEKEDKQRLLELEECVLENYANAHGNSKMIWGYLKVMCSLSNAEVNRYQKEWGENLELLKKKKADKPIFVN